MERRVQNALYAAVVKLLRPLIQIFLRNGLPFGVFADLARWVYVDVAYHQFGIAGRKQSDSRIAILTGLTRKEVRRLRSMAQPTDAAAVERYNRAARVIAGWRRDPQFVLPDGSLRALPFEGDEVSFGDLVRRYSGDVPPRAVLDELMQIKAVEKSANDEIVLLTEAYLPSGDTETMHSILGTDVALLIGTIDHNTRNDGNSPRLQRKVAYDNVPEEATAQIRGYCSRAGQHLLEQLDRTISQHDRDVNRRLGGTGRKHIGVGIYYFEEDAHEEQAGSGDRPKDGEDQ